MRKLAPLLLVLGLCACGGSSAVTTATHTTTASPPPKPGRAVFTTSGTYVVTCDIAFHAPHVGTHSYCVHSPPGQPRNAVAVVMRPSGSFRTCTGAKCVRKLRGVATKVGKDVTVGPYQCSVLATGVLCDVAETGRGFLITGTGVKPVS